MKKIGILGFACFLSMQAVAQVATLEAAQDFIKSNDFVSAKKMIDELTAAGGKEEKNASAWFTKGYVYQKIADDPKPKISLGNGYTVAFDAYKKYMSLDKKTDNALVKENMLALLGNFYNVGIGHYNDKRYTEAISNFDLVSEVKASDAGGKLFASDKIVDTIEALSKMYKGYCLYNDKKYGECATIFEGASSNPITKDADIYLRLASVYQNNGDNDKWIGAIQKGIAAYPSNADLKNEEINYFLLTNKQEELIKRLEDATTRDAKNAQLMFSLASAYDGLLKEKKSSDAEPLRKKTIAAYEKAVLLDPKNGDYVYNIGAMHYNQAVEVNENINKNKDNKAMLETLKKSREEFMKKSIPYMEKAVGLYEGQGGVVRESDKLNYKNAVESLIKMFDILKMTDKKDAMSKKKI
jgi:tetratricopeptide (TPR) repeat protein